MPGVKSEKSMFEASTDRNGARILAMAEGYGSASKGRHHSGCLAPPSIRVGVVIITVHQILYSLGAEPRGTHAPSEDRLAGRARAIASSGVSTSVFSTILVHLIRCSNDCLCDSRCSPGAWRLRRPAARTPLPGRSRSRAAGPPTCSATERSPAYAPRRRSPRAVAGGPRSQTSG